MLIDFKNKIKNIIKELSDIFISGLLWAVILFVLITILGELNKFIPESLNQNDVVPSYEDGVFSQVEQLQEENKDLKERLENIQDMANNRNYYYPDLLDDIEDEANY